MTIAHTKILLRQDSDIEAVREIVSKHDGSHLDDDNYIVYYNTTPTESSQLIEALHSFTYSVEITNEVF